ncbi:hypothetical protein [Microbacterium sp. NPDC055683]
MDDELRLLHEQAFGRRADGATRDAAMARLADIDAERGQRMAEPAAAARDDVPAATSAAVERSELDPLPSPEDVPHETSGAGVAQGEPSRGGVEHALRRFGTFVESLPRGRAILLWAGSLVVTALITAGLAAATSQIDPWRVAELRIDPDGEIPREIGVPDDGVVVFDDFAGFAVISIPGGIWAPGGEDERCVSGFERDPGDDQGSYGFGGCTAGPFPAVATLTVDENMPDELQDQFPAGTALQFELDGDRVIVRAG